MTAQDFEWAKSLIKPDLPEYDEKDHEIAKLRFIMNEIVEELCHLHYRTSDIADTNRVSDIEEAHELLGRILYLDDGEMNIPDGTSQEEIDAYAEKKRWAFAKAVHLEDHHCGDCTAVSASCMKCHAEQFYGFETPYEGKAAGSKALRIYTETMKAENGEKQ